MILISSKSLTQHLRMDYTLTELWRHASKIVGSGNLHVEIMKEIAKSGS